LCRKQAQDRQIIASGFTEKFHLKANELALLKGLGHQDEHQDIVIDDHFFDILEKVRKIHEDSKMLLKSKQQITGIETMDAMSANEEAALERLYKWTLNSLRTFNSDAYEINLLLHKAMRYIEERSVLFKHCLDEYCSIRKAALVRNFVDALTRKSPSSPGPIDLHSADHIRYVGDIMAWVHQAIASEKEMLHILLQKCNKEELTKNQTIKASLSLITESLVRPIKARIEQLLVSPSNSKQSCGLVILFKVKNLIKFYENMLSEEILPKSQLSLTLSELDSLAHRVFINSLNFQCSYKLGKTSEGEYEEPCADLLPTESFIQTINLLKEILLFQDSSFLSSQDKQEVVLTVINVVIKPYLKVCRIVASKLSSTDLSIFLLNCLNDVYLILNQCEFTDELKDAIKGSMDDHIESLITERVMNILVYFGLTAIFNAIKNETTIPLSNVTGCDSLALQSCSVSIQFEPKTSIY